MNGVLERSLGMLELLATHPQGLSLAHMAESLSIPRSAVHRLLADLVRCGYVRQAREHGDYVLTTRLAALGLGFLSAAGIVDIAQPVLDRLADASGELLRLAVVDGDHLTWVAKAQGARSGLRYDPDQGMDAHLASTSTGHAWLMTLPEARALELATRQGFGTPGQFGPAAPATASALLDELRRARTLGYSMSQEMSTAGMSALGAPVTSAGQPAIGVITIAGPTQRLTDTRMQELVPPLLAAADELACGSAASPSFRTSAVEPRHADAAA